MPHIKTTSQARETLQSLMLAAMPGPRKCLPNVAIITDRQSLLPSLSSLEYQHPTPSLHQAAVGRRMLTARWPRRALPTQVPWAWLSQAALARGGTSRAHIVMCTNKQAATAIAATPPGPPHFGATPLTLGRDGSTAVLQSAGTVKKMNSWWIVVFLVKVFIFLAIVNIYGSILWKHFWPKLYVIYVIYSYNI